MKRILLFAVLALASVPILSAQNLLTNGNFETGGAGVGFNVSGAGYTQLLPPFSGTTVQGNFALTNNPAQFNTSYLAVGDHSTGTGSMLMVDGNASAVGQPLFWQTGNTAGGNVCGLTIGNNYIFTYWVRSLSNAVTNAATQANLLLVSNNATAPVLSVGSTTAPLPAAGWQQVSYTFTASAACVQLGLWNNNTNGTGNDFAVDDFSLVALPTATISAAPASACVGGASPLITFTGANGTPPYTFNYTVNTVAQPPVSTTAASNTVTVPVPTGTPGTFTYALTSVSYGTTPTYTQNQTGSAAVTVKPLPTGTIAGTATVCKDAVGTFVTFTGSGGTAPYFFYYSINGGSTQIVSSGSSNSAAVLVPTNTTGTFTYELIKTNYGSGPACEDVNAPGSQTAAITVLPVPTATISGTTNVCLNAPGVFITFTGANSTAPYTFNYTLNGNPYSATSVGNSVTVPVDTSVPGVFTYELVSVSTGSAPVCTQPAEGTAVVTVGPPTSTISGSTTILAGGAATITFNGTPGATIAFTTVGTPGAPATTNTSIVIGADGTAHYNIPYIAQTFTFSLISATSGFAPFCTQPLSGSATVTVDLNTCALPLADVTIDVPQPICNTGECSELLAHFSNVGKTNDYVVSAIPYCPSFPFTGGTQINVPCDDVWSNIVTLPFKFNFYDGCYDQVRVGSNGVITFDLVGPPYTAGGCSLLYCNWPFTATIPNTAFPIKNAIYGVYQDTNMAQPPITNPAIQNVNYYVLDTGPNAAPNRVFVANFNELPQFSCNNSVGLQTSQIVIHETTNIIEVFVNKRTSCTGWNSGSGLIGIQNLAGTQAVVPPLRNTGTWSANNEAWRFYPKNIPTIPTQISWEQVGVGPIGSVNENPIRVCPTGPTTYTAVVKYTDCIVAELRENIFVDVAPPLPVANPVDIDICSNLPPPYTVNINQTPAMIAGIPNPGDYWIKYYEDETDAQNDASNNIPPAQLPNFITSGPFPKTIYIRIEDLVTTGCFNIRPFVLDVGGPSGTFAYMNSPYCNNITTPEAPTLASLTAGGSYAAQSVPAGSTLILDPVTGAITPAGSDPAQYIVTYSIPANPPCPAYSTQTSVEIVLCTCTVTASSNAATLCKNTPLTPITYTTSGATSGSVTAGTLPPGVTGAFAGGVFTVSGTPTTAGVYTYTVSIVSGPDTCTATTTITVNDVVGIALSSAVGTDNQTLCANSAITNITYAVTNGATGATVTGLPATLTATFAGGTLTISGTPTTPGPINYTVTTSGGCGTASLSGTITVTPGVTLALTSASGTDAQTLCVNTPITNITYAVGNGATGATVLGLPATLTANFAAGVLTISGTPTAAATINYTVSTTGGCGTASLSGTITVNPNVTIALTSAAGTDAQTVCINTPITNIVYTTTNGATGVTATGLPAGVTGAFVGGVYTLSGSPSGAGVFNYSLTTTGGCATATITGSITVNPNVTLVLTSPAATANQTVCINTPIANIVYTTANGVTGITATGLPGGVTGAFVGGVYTLSGSPSGSGIFNYSLTTTGGCSTATLNGTITVNPDTTIALTSATGTDAQTVCINASITNIEYTVGNGATGVTVTGLPTGITGVYAAGVFTISGATALTGPFNYTVTTTGGCAPASLSGSITINANVTIALTSPAPTANQTVCINDPITNIVYTTTNGATGVTDSGLPAGVTGAFVGGVYTLSGSPSGSGVFNYSLTTTGGCGTATINGTITVNPAVTIVQTSAAGTEAQTVCINTPIANIVYTVGNGATGATVLGLPTGVTGTFAAGVFTISGTPSGAGPFPYTVTTTGGCGTASLSGTITVNPDVTIALTSAVGTDNQTACINTPIANIVYTTANGATGVTDAGLPPGVTGAFVGGVYTLSGSPSGVGTFNYTLTTTGGCSSDTATGTIVVNPNVNIVQTSPAGTEAQTLCINTPITNIVYTVGNGATGATVTGLPGGVTGTFAAGVFTISGSPNVAGPFSYTVTTTGGCGTASLSGTINVNLDATIALTSAAPTANQTVCINAPIVNIVYTISNGGTGATVTGLPTGITGVYAAGVFTISGATALTGPFNYTVTTTGGCSSDSESGTITINPDVTIALTSPAPTAAQTVCINTPIANIIYTITNSATGATTSGLPAGVTGAFVAGVYTLSGSPSASGVFNYTVTTTGGCGVASINGTITVNPNATIALTSPAPTAAQTVCINTPILNIVYTVANGATGASATGLPAGVTGTFAGGVFTISGTPSGAGPFNYTVTTSGGCATASLSGSITVTPNVTLTLTSLPATTNQSVCINTPIAGITYAVANAGATGATVTGLPTGITGAYNATTGVYTISGTPTGVGTFNYIVTTAGGCSSATLNGTIIVRPNATLTLTSPLPTASQTVCINSPIVATVYTIGNGATGASITSGGLPAGVTGTFAGGVFTISGTPTNAGTFNYAVTTTGGCSSASLTGTIVVNPNVTLVLTSSASTTNQIVCTNVGISTITYAPGNGATGATAVGLPAGISGVYAGGIFTITGSAAVPGTYNYTVTTVGGCSTASLNGTIQVTPNVTVTRTSAAGTDAQQVCEIQQALVDITYAVGNGATGASVVAGTLPIGISQSFAAGVLTISGTPTEVGTFTYTVTTTGGCGVATATGTIRVNPLPVITLPQGFICVDQSGNPLPGSNYLLTTGLSAATHTFQWSDASGPIPTATGSSYLAVAPGTYSVAVTNNVTGCYNTGSTTVITSFPPQIVKASASLYFAEDQSVSVAVLPVGNYEYQLDNGQWQDSNQFHNLPSGYHTITVRDKVGCGEMSTEIRIIDYPKFFTPNNDGYNDTWNIFDLQDQPMSKIEIFDRYGKLIKEISPKGKGWDGMMNGYPLPSTDYWFKVHYNDESGNMTEFKSHFSLKR